MTLIVELILTTGETRGKGTPEDPCRALYQLFTKDGRLVAEQDPHDHTRNKCWLVDIMKIA